MGNEALNLDGSLTGCIKSENSSDMRMAEHVMWWQNQNVTKMVLHQSHLSKY